MLKPGGMMAAVVLLVGLTAGAASPSAVTPETSRSARSLGRGPDVDWRPEPWQIVARCQREIAKARERVGQATSRPPRATPLAGGLLAVESAVADVDDALVAEKLLADVADDKAVRAASVKCNEDLAAFRLDVSASPAVYALAKRAQAQAVTPAERQLARRYVEEGRRAGAELGDAARAELTKLFDQLDKLQRAFRQALGDDRATILISKAEAESLPAAFAAHLEERRGGYAVPVNLQTYETFMRGAASGAARRRYLTAYFKRGGAENARRVRRAVRLRRRIARRLGFDSWAAYQLETKMAKTPRRALALLREVGAKVLPKARAELAQLAALKSADGDRTPLAAWDYLFYQERLERARYSFDSEAAREYFPVDRVVAEVMRLYEALLGVRFGARDSTAAWAPGVELYEITDARSGRPVGWFYLDLLPRPGKYLRPANFPLRAGRALPDGSYRLPISSIIGNGPAPAPGRPALFSHRDAVEFFHEFGHLMHTTLSTARFASLYGANVRGDFVEAPSQMLENWMWQRAVLKRVSGRVGTGEPLPDELIDRMVALKQASGGLFWSRQVFLAVYDLTLHGAQAQVDPDRLWFTLTPRLTPLPPLPGTLPSASFLPIMGGYDAGYYGYVWSRVYAQDMFTAFEQSGPDDARVGMRYRMHILEPGGTAEPDELLKNFLGRPVSPDAFYRELGIEGMRQTPRRD